jgi:hypothetical protein
MTKPAIKRLATPVVIAGEAEERQLHPSKRHRKKTPTQPWQAYSLKLSKTKTVDCKIKKGAVLPPLFTPYTTQVVTIGHHQTPTLLLGVAVTARISSRFCQY